MALVLRLTCTLHRANIEFSDQSYGSLTLEDLGAGVGKLADMFNAAASGFDVRNEITFDLEANRTSVAVVARYKISSLHYANPTSCDKNAEISRVDNGLALQQGVPSAH